MLSSLHADSEWTAQGSTLAGGKWWTAEKEIKERVIQQDQGFVGLTNDSRFKYRHAALFSTSWGIFLGAAQWTSEKYFCYDQHKALGCGVWTEWTTEFINKRKYVSTN